MPPQYGYFEALARLTVPQMASIAAVLAAAYLIGSIPWSYLIVKWVTGEDITAHGTGNVGAMNVRRTTGSWGWFTVAMLADGLKGFLPVLLVRVPGYLGLVVGADSFASVGPWMGTPDAQVIAAEAALLGAVLGHNYSLWLSLAKRRLTGGKGLATGAGALLSYDPVYFGVVLVTGLGVIAVTRYMMAGQVAAAVALPLFATATGQWDWPFTVLAAALVYARHHRRFVGLLKGEEPKLYVNDRMGPRG